jgi:hypothetical protein
VIDDHAMPARYRPREPATQRRHTPVVQRPLGDARSRAPVRVARDVYQHTSRIPLRRSPSDGCID